MRQSATTQSPEVTQTTPQTSPPYSYNQPFVQPAPVWDYWFLLLLPLLAAICLVYKTIKVGHIRELPRQAGGMLALIVVGLALASVALWLFVKVTG